MNNKDVDQQGQLCSLISANSIVCLDSIITNLVKLNFLTLFLLKPELSFLLNTVDPDQLASEEAI